MATRPLKKTPTPASGKKPAAGNLKSKAPMKKTDIGDGMTATAPATSPAKKKTPTARAGGSRK